jgi:hypothetical protein
LATPNYGYEKRQKELAKKKKKEDKLKNKADRKVGEGEDEGAENQSPDDTQDVEGTEPAEPGADAPPV